MAGFDFQQRQTQTQTQIMSQRQIQSLDVLSLSSDELRESIYREVESNPAIVVSGESRTFKRGKIPGDNTRIVSSTSSSAQLASDNFQKALESQVDKRETLQNHLMQQLNMMNFTPEKHTICQKLIFNLSTKGFHILSPASLLDRSNPLHTLDLLEDCMKTVQQMDPTGTCTRDFEESLYVQAVNHDNAPKLALFLLKNNLEFINPPVAERAVKKIKAFLSQQKNLFAQTEELLDESIVTEKNVQEAIEFIKTLNPFPASEFGTESTHFVEPDIYVEKVNALDIKENFEKGIIDCDGTFFEVRLAQNTIPQLSINPIYQKISEASKETGYSKDEKKYAASGIKAAKEFMENIEFRENTILKSCCILVKKQQEFFKKGIGNLSPFTQKNLAEILQVHESTVSRMARSKYIQCEWGLFEISYFFTNEVSRKPAATANIKDGYFSIDEQAVLSSPKPVSKDNIVHMIQEILEEHKNDKKKLSDQKICDLLAQKGITVARRTIAKYRSQLNIDSSYNR